MIVAGVLVLIGAALVGAPLFAVVAGAAMLGFYAADIDLSIVAIELYRIVDTPMLVALPLFTYSGYLLAEGNTSQRLVNLVHAAIGRLPGGLAIVGFLACALFTALTGASGVTIVAIGALLLPALVRSGYTERFSLGLVTTSGSLGLLIVPSLPLILYGIVAQQMDVGESFTLTDLFLAGLMPVGVMLTALIVYTLISQREHLFTPGLPAAVDADDDDEPAQPRVSLRRALFDARWEVPLPFVVLGGVYGGVFAISEAAAVTAVYVSVSTIVMYREVPLKSVLGVMTDSMTMVGGILLILGVALAFTNYLVDAEVPQTLFELTREQIESPLAFLLVLNVTLLVLGAVLDIFSALVIMVPLILPVAAGYGIHPVHLGIIFLANMQIGYFTPPIGMNLFIASYRFKKSIFELYAACLPFMLVLLMALLLITYVPWFSLAFIE